MKTKISLAIILIASLQAFSQDTIPYFSLKNISKGINNTFKKGNNNQYKPYYFIGEDSELRKLTPYTDKESFLFEAIPIVRFNLVNNFQQKLTDTLWSMHSWYVEANQHLRMVIDESLPVRTPNHQISLGRQQFIRIQQNQGQSYNRLFLGYSIESGHYSNGQYYSAFDEEAVDGSPESQAVYETITDDSNLSDMLNRKTGNFSTNRTKYTLGVRKFFSYIDDRPDTQFDLDISLEHWHDKFWYCFDFGGYSDADIEIYGKLRFGSKLGYSKSFKIYKAFRTFRITNNFEFIHNPHKSVNPFRNQFDISFFPNWQGFSKNFNFKIGYVAGHDNYNFRFVDNGSAFFFGLSFSPWRAIKLP